MSCLVMVIPIKENTLKEKPMEKEHTYGEMARSMTESGTMDRNLDTVYGRASMETVTSASGKTVRLKVMECIYGWTATGMKVSGPSASGMETELISLPMEITILANTSKASRMDLGSTNGPVQTLIPVNSRSE